MWKYYRFRSGAILASFSHSADFDLSWNIIRFIFNYGHQLNPLPIDALITIIIRRLHESIRIRLFLAWIFISNLHHVVNICHGIRLDSDQLTYSLSTRCDLVILYPMWFSRSPPRSVIRVMASIVGAKTVTWLESDARDADRFANTASGPEWSGMCLSFRYRD